MKIFLALLIIFTAQAAAAQTVEKAQSVKVEPVQVPIKPVVGSTTVALIRGEDGETIAEVGRLDWTTGKLTFSGNLDLSAKALFLYLQQMFEEYRASKEPPLGCSLPQLWEMLKKAHEEFIPTVGTREQPEIKKDSSGKFFVVHPREAYLNEVKQTWEGNIWVKGIPYGWTPEQLEREAEKKKEEAAVLRRRIALAQEIERAIISCKPQTPPQSAPQGKQ